MTKFFGCAAGVACALVLSSCGSDSSSGPGEDLPRMKISIDESNKTITMYDYVSFDFCVYDSIGNRFDWKKDALMHPYTLEQHYLFHGDTLVFFGEEGTSVFVGGKANTIYGRWKGLYDCSYDVDEDEILCRDTDADVADGSHYLIFHKDYAEAEYIAPEVFNDYTNSVWMRLFYDGLRTQDFMFLPNYIFVDGSDSTAAEWNELGIKVKSQSKSKISFVFGEKNVSIEFADVTGDFSDFSYTANVRVDDKTCSLQHASHRVTEELCSAENADYFDMDTFEDENMSLVYANGYYKNNDKEFEQCLESAFGFVAEVVKGNSEIFYKKLERDDVSIREANRKRLEKIYRAISGSVI